MAGFLGHDAKKYQRVLLIAAGADFEASHPFAGTYFEQLLTKEGVEVIRDGNLKEKNNDFDLVLYLLNFEPGFFVQTLYIPKYLDMFRWYATRVPTCWSRLATRLVCTKNHG